MLIRIDRILAAEQIRTLYGMPNELFTKVVSSLPVFCLGDDGTPSYLESQVDEFLHRMANSLGGSRIEVTTPHPALECADAEPTAHRKVRRSAFLNLKEAAAYLRYEESWFRQVVKSGLVKHWQARKNAPIKFKKEWLDEFVEATTKGGSQTPRIAGRQQRKKVKFRSASDKTFGLDADLMP